MRPPIIATSRAEIVRPSPVPPKRRVVEPSAWLNASKISACLSRGMPMPVSRDRDVQRLLVGRLRLAPRRGTTTSPRSVNLTALPTRLTRICRSRPDVADQRVGHVGGDVADQLEPLLVRAARASAVSASSSVSRSSNCDGLELEPARLDLREVENVVDDREQRLGRGA